MFTLGVFFLFAGGLSSYIAARLRTYAPVASALYKALGLATLATAAMLLSPSEVSVVFMCLLAVFNATVAATAWLVGSVVGNRHTPLTMRSMFE